MKNRSFDTIYKLGHRHLPLGTIYELGHRHELPPAPMRTRRRRLRSLSMRTRGRRLRSSSMKNPPSGTIYKSWTDAYRAAENLKKQNTDMDAVIRVEKAPYSDGYIVCSTPVFLEMALLKLGMRRSGVFFPAFSPVRPGFDDKN